MVKEKFNELLSLGYENNNVNTESIDLRSGNLAISKAKFRDQKSLRQYEPWTKGRPEVAVTITNKPYSSINKEFGDKGWWDGATNNLNYKIPLTFERMDQDRYYYPLVFAWFELDYEFQIKKKSTTVPIYDQEHGNFNFKFNIIVPINWLGDSNDFMGYNYVNISDKNGQMYATKNGKWGDDDFYMWIAK